MYIPESNSVVPLTLSTMYECLLLALSYIAESVRGTRELDTATQAAHYINLNIHI